LTTSADLTLDEMRLALAPAIASAAVFDGWSNAAVAAAAEARGIKPEVAALAYPGGAMDMIAAWIETVDAAMDVAFAGGALHNQPIRERISRLLRFRLDALTGREEAVKRALAVMAMPQNAARSLQMGWASADKMWRLAGDTATDYNHYTKRAILGGIYTATLAVFAHDDSEGKTESLAFLDRRIAGVMRFEKAKAQFLRPDEQHFSMARFLGRLRYPAV
jgi:ubiquinone biosynthesis protein COQ9